MAAITHPHKNSGSDYKKYCQMHKVRWKKERENMLLWAQSCNSLFKWLVLMVSRFARASPWCVVWTHKFSIFQASREYESTLHWNNWLTYTTSNEKFPKEQQEICNFVQHRNSIQQRTNGVWAPQNRTSLVFSYSMKSMESWWNWLRKVIVLHWSLGQQYNNAKNQYGDNTGG